MNKEKRIKLQQAWGGATENHLSMNLCCPRRLGVSPRPPQHRGVIFDAWSGRVGSYSATALVPKGHQGGRLGAKAQARGRKYKPRGTCTEAQNKLPGD